MSFEPITISAFSGISIFLFIIGLFSDDGGARQRDGGYWLWTDLRGKLFDALFQNRDPADIGKMLGLEYDKYMLNCNIMGHMPDIKKEVMDRAIASTAFIAGALLTVVFLNPVPLTLAILLYLWMVVRVVNGVEAQAKKRKKHIIHDLPRFTDLLHSILMIDVPVKNAIEMTARLLPCVLSREMSMAVAEMQIGAKNWQTALEDMARKYEVDVFSDFVLDLVTASSKGVPIVDAVKQKSTEIKQQRLLDAKEKVSRMNNSVLIPVAVFKILPLLMILLIPIMIQIFNNF